QRGWYAGIQLVERRRLLRPELLQHLQRIWRGERRSSADQLVEHGSRREDVRAMVTLTSQLLRRGVAAGANNEPGPLGVYHLGDTQDLHRSASQQHDLA